jgi:hypothetical protein
VIGRIVTLRADSDPSDLLTPTGEREIIIEWVSGDQPRMSVRVALNPAQYLEAAAAHTAGRLVMVSGTLEHRGRSGFMSAPLEFSVQS